MNHHKSYPGPSDQARRVAGNTRRSGSHEIKVRSEQVTAQLEAHRLSIEGDGLVPTIILADATAVPRPRGRCQFCRGSIFITHIPSFDPTGIVRVNGEVVCHLCGRTVLRLVIEATGRPDFSNLPPPKRGRPSKAESYTEEARTIGAVLLYLRKDRNWSRSAVAAHIGCSRSTLDGWELGEIVPSSDALRQLARLYGVTVQVLRGEQAAESVRGGQR